ncbi:alpha/beta fold hydrolase [Agreia pratensis]|uniref:alpha/beta fold hydrolase n=1 Tax=Agreia pratensis TaxID=150121 RepID=UPI002B2660C1|nr:alpha/beta fold hydrolase [Agreia pratensis]
MSIPTIAITEPTGPPGAPLLVLGPSLGTSTILWQAVTELMQRSHRVLAWDLPGHGNSPPAGDGFTVGEIALGVLDAVAALGETHFRYAGVSLGGAVGLEALLAAPGRVDAAAIICSGAKIGSTDGWVDRAAVARAQGTASLVASSAERWFAPGSIARQPDAAGRLLHSLRDADDESYARCAEALANYDVRSLLSNITVPVLAMWGEHDSVTPRSNAEEIAEGVADGRAVVVADAGHLAPAEQPAAVASLITDFFEGAA